MKHSISGVQLPTIYVVGTPLTTLDAMLQPPEPGRTARIYLLNANGEFATLVGLTTIASIDDDGCVRISGVKLHMADKSVSQPLGPSGKVTLSGSRLPTDGLLTIMLSLAAIRHGLVPSQDVGVGLTVEWSSKRGCYVGTVFPVNARHTRSGAVFTVFPVTEDEPKAPTADDEEEDDDLKEDEAVDDECDDLAEDEAASDGDEDDGFSWG